MFKLSDLLNYDDIVLQCHNFPDADTIASAFAVYVYLKANGKDSRIIYSGSSENSRISKPNLLKMTELLSIPLEYVKGVSSLPLRLPRCKTLVTIDCQYGESNVVKFDAETIFVIDHHESKKTGHMGTVRSYLGSCATLVWDLLKEENFDLDSESHLNVSTALYYGLYTDTSNLEEISHPLDKDMRDSLNFDHNIINTLRFNNLTIDELSIAGTALTRYTINERFKCAILRADACDPNILGFISDLALQVEGADVCIVYNTLSDGYKLSVRSCTKEVMANEFAGFLAGGGGHKQKAGGFISKSETDSAETDIEQYIKSLLQKYFDSYDVVHADNHSLNIAEMPRYSKMKIPVRYVKSADVFKEGTPILIRTLEGDAEAVSSERIYLMIGILGEVYPTDAEKFKQSYMPISASEALESDFTFNYTYSPTVKNKITGETAELITFSKTCVSDTDSVIYAAPIKRNTKVFTRWNTDGYMHGVPGDYIAVRENDLNDVYIIRGDIFLKTYEIREKP
jgi:phosphoglycolate phosphatase